MPPSSTSASLAAPTAATRTYSRWEALPAVVAAGLGLTFLAWVLLPALLAGNPHPDTIEGVYWGREWLWGYHKHPPLAAWAAETVHLAFGSAGWAYYALSQLFIAAAFAAIWVLVSDIAGRRAALVAMVLMALTHFTGYSTPRFNPNVVQFTFWAWTLAAFWRAVDRDRLVWWCLAGLAAGLGILAKYSIGVLLVTLLAWLAINPTARRHFKRPGLYIGFAVFLVVIGPHLAWLVQNDFVTFHYFAARSDETLVGPSSKAVASHLAGPLSFLGDQAFAILPMLFAAGIALAVTRRHQLADLTRRIQQRLQTTAGSYLLFAYLAPIALLALASLATGVQVRTMWGMSFVLAAPALLAVALPELNDGKAGRPTRRFFITSALLWPLFAIGFVVLLLVKPALSGKPNIMNQDGPALARAAEELWYRTQPGNPGTVIGTLYEAGTAAFYIQPQPHVFENADHSLSPWGDEAHLLANGALYVSRRRPDPGEVIGGLCPEAVTQYRWPARTAFGIPLADRPLADRVVWIAILPGRSQPATTCPVAGGPA